MKVDNRYWAGLFDGEGSVYIYPHGKGMQISITQKDVTILHLLKLVFGGDITKYGKQTCHKWRVINGMEMKNFLTAIVPYAIIKALDVQVALEFLSKWRHSGKGYHPLPKEEAKRRQELRDRLYTVREIHKN